MAGVQLRFEAAHVRFRLLQRETAPAPVLVSCDIGLFFRAPDRLLARARATDGGAQLLIELLHRAFGHRELRLEGLHPQLVGVDRSETAPALLTALLGSTGTSVTRPRTCGTTCTTYLITRTSEVDGA